MSTNEKAIARFERRAEAARAAAEQLAKGGVVGRFFRAATVAAGVADLRARLFAGREERTTK